MTVRAITVVRMLVLVINVPRAIVFAALPLNTRQSRMGAREKRSTGTERIAEERYKYDCE